MRRWLPRFAFSLLILAAVLAWEGRRVATGERRSRLTPAAFYTGATVCFLLGIAAIRERHRRE
jgi:hypothetical protein